MDQIAAITIHRMFLGTHNRDPVGTTSGTATAVIIFNNCEYYEKFLLKKKFILLMSRTTRILGRPTPVWRKISTWGYY